MVITILSVKKILSPAVSKCEKIDTLSVKPISFLMYPEIFIEKIEYVSEILRFEGLRGHPIIGSFYMITKNENSLRQRFSTVSISDLL